MKKQIVKMMLLGLCMLAAGICYSCRKEMPERADKEARLETERIILSETESPTTEPAARCYVHVCGEVMNPGVYELEEGSRVFQAIEKAGGLTELADAEYLNMAQTVEDGMKIQVLSAEEAKSLPPYGQQDQVSDVQTQKINLNTAVKEQLMTLNGIGEARAEDILRYREEHGYFETIEEIMEIPGIKDAAFQKIKEHITV